MCKLLDLEFILNKDNAKQRGDELHLALWYPIKNSIKKVAFVNDWGSKIKPPSNGDKKSDI